jgi:hypothetical protein
MQVQSDTASGFACQLLFHPRFMLGRHTSHLSHLSSKIKGVDTSEDRKEDFLCTNSACLLTWDRKYCNVAQSKQLDVALCR